MRFESPACSSSASFSEPVGHRAETGTLPSPKNLRQAYGGMKARTTGPDKLELAREALARHEWTQARDLLLGLDMGGSLDADGLLELADALGWCGEPDRGIEVLERAYAIYLAAGNLRAAAATAVMLSREQAYRWRRSIATGWLNRGRRLLEREGDCPEWTAWHLRRARQLSNAGQHRESLDAAREAGRLARTHRLHGLELVAMHVEGQALVRLGEVAAGIALVDEVSAAASGGELDDPFWTGLIFCWTIDICESIADYGRAGEITEATAQWCQSNSVPAFLGICRVHRAHLMGMRGNLEGAESEASAAAEHMRRFNLRWTAVALSQLGDIRLRRGRIHDAEATYREAAALGLDPNPGYALLVLRQGKPAAAAASLQRSLAQEADRTTRARLLSALARCGLALNAATLSEAAAAELEAIASAYGQPAIRAQAAVARGIEKLLAGSAEAATFLRAGIEHWNEVDAPFELADTRLLLARTLRLSGDEPGANFEQEAASELLTNLGAVPWPGLAAPGEGPGLTLTGRELQVARMVSHGLTNKGDRAAPCDPATNRRIPRRAGPQQARFLDALPDRRLVRCAGPVETTPQNPHPATAIP